MKPLRCLLGLHDYTWCVTATDPTLNWEQCDRCGHVREEHRDQWERYQEYKAEKSS